MNQAPKSEAVLEHCERWVRAGELRESFCIGMMLTGIVAILGESLSHFVPILEHRTVWITALVIGGAVGLRSWYSHRGVSDPARGARRVYASDIVDLLEAAPLAQGRLAELVVARAEARAESLLALPLPRAPRPMWLRESLATVILGILIGTIPHSTDGDNGRAAQRVRDVAAAVSKSDLGTFSTDPDLLRVLDSLRDPSLSVDSAKNIAKALTEAAKGSDTAAALDRLRYEPEWRDGLAETAATPLNARLRERLANLSPLARARLADALRDASNSATPSVASALRDAATNLAAGASGAASAADAVAELVRLDGVRRELMDVAVALRSAAGGGDANAFPTSIDAPRPADAVGHLTDGERRELEGPDAAIVRRYFELRGNR